MNDSTYKSWWYKDYSFLDTLIVKVVRFIVIQKLVSHPQMEYLVIENLSW